MADPDSYLQYANCNKDKLAKINSFSTGQDITNTWQCRDSNPTLMALNQCLQKAFFPSFASQSGLCRCGVEIHMTT